MKTNYQIIYCFYTEKVFVCLKGEVGSGWHRKKKGSTKQIGHYRKYSRFWAGQCRLVVEFVVSEQVFRNQSELFEKTGSNQF